MLAEFPLDIEIEEKLYFEKLGNTKCNQCQKNHENGQDKATRICHECGFICSKCYDSHTSMKTLRTHKISSIPFESLPDNLKSALSELMSCKQHREETIKSFCKNCKKAVCEKCIVESHSECRSKICTIDDEVKEIIKDFQKRLFDIDLDVTRVEKTFFEKMKKHQDEMERKIKQWRLHSNEKLKNTSDEVETLFQEKAIACKNEHEKTKEELQMIKKTQRRFQRFLEGASLLHNKVGILQYALKIRESMQSLQNDVNMIKKVVSEQEDTSTDDHDFVKTICKDDSLGNVTSGDKKKSDSSPVLVYTSSQRRHHYEEMVHGEENRNERSSLAKCYVDEKRMELHSETSVARYLIKYKTTMFPRYKYHLELIQKIIDREREVDAKTNINDKSNQSTRLQYEKETGKGPEQMVDVSTFLQSNIILYGRATYENRKLLWPLELQEPVENEQHFGNDILVAFGDEIDADLKTSFYSTIQEQMNKYCWCILVSSETDTEKLMNSSPVRKFSIVPPNPDAVWNHLTSAMELKLIEFLNVKSRNMELPLSIREDVKTVLKGIEQFAVFKNNQESNEIPTKIQEVLKRFEKAIVQYGFNFENFRVIVKNERFEEVDKALHATGLYDSFSINVICQDDFVEKIELYNDPGVTNINDTFVSLPFLTNVKTVPSSCRHIWKKDGITFIENGLYDRNPLGTSCLGTTEVQAMW